MLGTIIVIILTIYAIIMTISYYKEIKFSNEIVSDYTDLNLDFIRALTERDDLKKEVEKQKDIIADLSRQINEATVKTVTDKKSSKIKTEEPKKEKGKKTTTAKKTTTRKTTRKKKEVKE